MVDNMKIINYKISREKIDNRDISEKITSYMYMLLCVVIIEAFIYTTEKAYKNDLFFIATLQVFKYLPISVPIISLILYIINPKVDIITIYFKDYETAKESQENTIDEIIEYIIKNDIYSSNLKNGFYIKSILSKKNKLILEEQEKKDIMKI